MLVAAGVNRVSIGVQSMASHVLLALNRTHDPDNVVRAVDAARAAGIGRVNLDLIYGTPGETLGRLARHARRRARARTGPRERVRAHGRGRDTRSASPSPQVRSPRPTTTTRPTSTSLADDVLTAAGHDWYEISNWARPGEECRHNLLYWQGGDYLAIGCAAHGKTGHRRWWNVRTPERYVAAVRDGASTEAGSEELDAAGRAVEMLGLALRTRAGAPVDRLDAAAVAELVAAGLADGRRPRRRAHPARATPGQRGRAAPRHVTADRTGATQFALNVAGSVARPAARRIGRPG